MNGPGHMTKMVAMPILVKTFKNLLCDPKSYDVETRDTRSTVYYVNHDLCMTLTILTVMSMSMHIHLNVKKLQSHLMDRSFMDLTGLSAKNVFMAIKFRDLP